MTDENSYQVALDSELRDAVITGSIDTVRDLIDQGADVNSTVYRSRQRYVTLYNRKILHEAASSNRYEIAELLLEAGADAMESILAG